MGTNWKTVMIGLALAGVSVVIYWPALSCGFVDLDDNSYVVMNEPIKQGISVHGLMFAWTTTSPANWHPLTMLSLELDSTIWGLSPFGYHATNLIFHASNVFLLNLLLWQLTQSVFRSACVAALFAFHPLHVESVAWISERKDVLSTFFLLLAIMAYCRYARRPSWPHYLTVLLLHAMGLLAKPMLVTTPLLLCLLDFWPLNRIATDNTPRDNNQFPPQSVTTILLEKTPLIVLSLVDGIITIICQNKAIGAIDNLTLVDRIANAFSAIGWYVEKSFVPTDLIAIYSYPVEHTPLLPALIGLAIVILTTVWSVQLRQRHPYLLVGWAWFLISLLPVIGLLQVGVQPYADRYTYIPHIGFFIFIVWGADSLLTRFKPGRIAGIVTLLACLLVFANMTQIQIGFWKSTNTLWTHALEVDSENSHAILHLANEMYHEGNSAEANDRVIQMIEKGLRLSPSNRSAGPYCILGRILVTRGQFEGAEQKFHEALQITPQHIPSLESLCDLMVAQKRYDEAAKLISKIRFIVSENSKKQPYSSTSQLNLGEMEMERGNTQKALGYYERAVRLNPTNGVARGMLAMAQLRLKQYPAAKLNFGKAIQLLPQLAPAHAGLAELLQLENDLEGARKHLAQAVLFDSNKEEYQQRLNQLTAPKDAD